MVLITVLLAVATAGQHAGHTPAPNPPAQGTPLPRAQGSVRLETLEREMLARHPEVLRATAAVEAARGRACQAGLPSNPTVGVEGHELRTEDARYGVFLAQRIPLFGRLSAARGAALAEVDRLEAERSRIMGVALADLRAAWYSVAAAQDRVAGLEMLDRASAEAASITEQLATGGAIDRATVLQTQIESGRARLAVTAARNTLSAAARRLAATAGDPGIEATALGGTLQATPPELTRDAIIEKILTASPRLLSARAARVAADARVTQAERAGGPDLVLRGGAAWLRDESRQRPGRDGWIGSFEAGVTLPLFNRNQGGIAAARAEQRMAAADVSRVELELLADAHQTFGDYLTALRASEEYRATLLPRAHEAYQLQLARYRDAPAAYPQLLTAHRSLMQLTEDYVTFQQQLWDAVVRLESLLAGKRN